MALLGTLINKFGKIAGWNSVKVVMLGRQIEGITALSYKDSKEKDNIYGAENFLSVAVRGITRLKRQSPF